MRDLDFVGEDIFGTVGLSFCCSFNSIKPQTCGWTALKGKQKSHFTFLMNTADGPGNFATEWHAVSAVGCSCFHFISLVNPIENTPESGVA